MAQTTPAPQSNAPASSEQPKANPIRLYILLGILAVAVVMVAYDQLVAKPSSEQAQEKLQALIERKNQQSVEIGADGNKSDRTSSLVHSDDIKQELGRQPSGVSEGENYTIETYAYGGLYPIWKKHFLTVVYVGPSRRYDTHYFNDVPKPEDLPNKDTIIDVSGEGLPAPGTGEVPSNSLQPENESEADKAAAEQGEKSPAPAPSEENPTVNPTESSADEPAAEAAPATEE